MLSLNKKVAYLTTVDRTILAPEIGLQEVKNEHVLDRTVAYDKADDNFAAMLLSTQRRVVTPFISGDLLVLPAASSYDVSAQMAGVPVAVAIPTYSNVTRTWSNLGAATYAPSGTDAGNKIFIRVKSQQGPDATETLRDGSGREVYGRLSNTGGASGTWTVSFFVEVASADQAYTLPAPVSAYLIFRQWVPASSPLLEDPNRVVFSAPGAVDLVETNNAAQLAGELGIVLGNDGAVTLPFGKTFKQKWLDHLAGVAGERHTTAQVDATAAVIAAIAGLSGGATDSDALIQLQTNLTGAATTAFANLVTYFKDIRSNGLIGTATALSSSAANTADVAPVVAYVDGHRWTNAGSAGVAVPNSTAKYFWIDAAGALQSGAAYPGSGSFARIGHAAADGAGVITLTDEHTPLVLLDQKVIDLEALITAHIASTTAHALASITYANGVAPLTLPDNTTPVSNAQQAVEALVRRLNAVNYGVKNATFTTSGGGEGDISTATNDGAISATAFYLDFAIPGGYKTGANVMQVLVDGDDTDILVNNAGVWSGTFKEQDANTVRIYWDTAVWTPQTTMNLKFRWLKV